MPAFDKHKAMAKSKKQNSESLALPLVNPCCAAIDVGSMLMMVSYTGRDGKSHLFEVDAFTESLKMAVQILLDAGVVKVAMEATGVYWLVIYQLLEQAGMEVIVVNANHFKNVDAQKTDVKDSQWLHQLHAHGLLRGSHVAPEVFRELRSYLHERDILQKQKSDTLNRIQKTLTQMNVKVQHLVSDIEGVNAMKLLRGIASGISDPKKLLALMNTHQLKSSDEELLKSLNGIYKEQHVTILKNQLVAFDFYKQQMKVYESFMEEVLKKLVVPGPDGKPAAVKPKKGLVRKNQYSINLKAYLMEITGIDLTAIPGLEEKNLIDIISVTGLDMSKWPTAGHFTSYLGLSPDPKISGGKVIGHKRKFTNNKATQAFRKGAQTMAREKGHLGHLYRKLSATKSSAKANKAIARKLAVIFYTMMNNKVPFDKSKMAVNTEKLQAKKIERLKKEAAKLGLVLNKAA